MKVAIIGTPGTGKTTLAAAVAAVFDLPILTAGDIARQSDPGAIARGDMGDAYLIRTGVEHFVRANDGWILDGYPRTRDQLESLTPGVEVILLTCRPDIARDRLLRRGREDDTLDLITKKIAQQSALMEVDLAGGWAYQAATWHRSVNTSRKRPVEVATGVIAYLRGEKREVA